MSDIQEPGAQALFDKFGTYILPGRVADPLRGLAEAQEAERIGLGTVWISERYATKEPAVLAGAVSQLTKKVRIGATMYITVRNPVVTASVANLMQALTGDRFRLLLARGVASHLATLGSPPITFERLKDGIDIIRRLWAGETVNYDGILGKYPAVQLTDRYTGPTPSISFTAIGPKSLAFAGEYCDGVLLHPFLTTEGVRKSAKIVHDAAEKAGRDPKSVRIFHNIIVAPDLDKDEEDAVVGGRAITYFQVPVYGEQLAEMNGWDTGPLTTMRNHPQFAALGGKLADQGFTRAQLVEVSRSLPHWWYEQGAAIGTAAQCASTLCDFLDAGADEIVLHGSAPAQMGPLTTELRKELVKRGAK
ncbi:MAG: family class F420-dependent oxidoreductase [Verrucomicrobiaceae bacterium]|nr:family class F420-dependent oxidoreductase [Verrucomicrobiaceae bacterium]